MQDGQSWPSLSGTSAQLTRKQPDTNQDNDVHGTPRCGYKWQSTLDVYGSNNWDDEVIRLLDDVPLLAVGV